MGEGKGLKVVLDTNILISALLFGGKLHAIVQAWKEGKIKLIFCYETLEEFIKVLYYPKFGLSEEEITYLVELETLPFSELIENSVTLSSDTLKDKDDIKFLECALSAKADYLVSGDKALLELKEYEGIKIISGQEFLEILKTL